MFRSVTDETIAEARCPRCSTTMTTTTYSDGTATTRCDHNPNHDGVVCSRVGHAEIWPLDPRCAVCDAGVAQWVRVEVREGKAYTYAWLGDPPLAPGEPVVLPGNVVKGRFTGNVLREVGEPGADGYPGPYKAVVRRACTCGRAYDDGCPEHGGLL